MNEFNGMRLQHLTIRRALGIFTATAALALAADVMAVSLVTWSSERDVAVANYVPGKHLVVKAGEKTETVAASDLLLLRYAATPPKTAVPSTTPVLWLDSGGWMSLKQVSFSENHFSFDSAFAGAGKVELNHVRAIAFQKTALEGTTGADIRRYASKPPKSDVLMILSADGRLVTLDGVFVKMDDKNVLFTWQEREQTISRERVVALVLAPVKPLNIDATEFATVVGNDGSALQGKLVDITAEAVSLDLAGVGKVQIPVAQLNNIDFVSGRSVYVSSLEPSQVTEVPYFDHVFPYRRDASVAGKTLSLRGIRYERGLGVHSRCVLSYPLNGSYRRLMGFIGIDDEVGRIGSVVFKVVADGKEIFNSGIVKGGEDVKRLSLDVSGVAKLTLEVDFGEDMDIGDHANWADLKLIK